MNSVDEDADFSDWTEEKGNVGQLRLRHSNKRRVGTQRSRWKDVPFDMTHLPHKPTTYSLPSE